MAGETPVGDAKVRVTPLPAQGGRSPAVRVQAAMAVDEPVVTVTLSAGCGSTVTRSYTFLSELPASVARSTAPVDVARLSGAAAVAPPESLHNPASARERVPSAVAPRQTSDAAAAAAATPARSERLARAAAQASPPRRTAVQAPAATAPQAGNRARLVVEPLELWLDRPVSLQASSELLVTPSDEPSAQRAQAAALWKALNTPPEDLLQESERLKTLEAEKADLQAQAGRERESAAQAQQQLAQALDERLPATVVYVLAGLLVASLLFVAWTLLRLRKASEKAGRAGRDSVAVMGARDTSTPARGEETALAPQAGDTWGAFDTLPTPPGPAATSVRQPLGAVPEQAPAAERFVETAPVFTAPAPQAPIVATVAAMAPAAATARQPELHIVSPEELFDIQQQAEFFVSVGEHQQAIQVLKNHIAERGDVSPLAYLELLRLYHTLSRVDEFNQLRQQFMQSFNAQVPEFAVFHRTGRMLYHYTEALAEIEAEWTTPNVLTVLERFLFRQAGGGRVERFDLAAYDELLLLLAIAQTTPASARGAPPPRERTTPYAPERQDTVVAHQPPGPAASAVSASASAPDSASAGLEFDLEALSLPAPLDGSVPSRRDPDAGAKADANAGPDTRAALLDLDLTEPPHLTMSDLPPVPVTAPPPPGGPVGFGMNNDLMELRLELEQQEPPKDRKQ